MRFFVKNEILKMRFLRKMGLTNFREKCDFESAIFVLKCDFENDNFAKNTILKM